MKLFTLLRLSLFFTLSTYSFSQGVSEMLQTKVIQKEATKNSPKYQAEAPLPKGWPTPGPYGKVSGKIFPAYRAAYTNGTWQSFAFLRLFKHIKRKKIPMTAPVEMDMEEKKSKLKMKAMGFMYQNMMVGKAGKDGAKVAVRDIAAMKTLSYTWMGKNSSRNRKLAKSAIDLALRKRGVTATGFRILGYNGPGVPDSKKTWEMLAVLPKKSK